MSFGQEIKDFLSAAQSTSKMLDDHNYNQLKGKYLQHLLSSVEGAKLRKLKVVVNPGNSGAGLLVD